MVGAYFSELRGVTFIAMVEAADLRNRNDAAGSR